MNLLIRVISCLLLASTCGLALAKDFVTVAFDPKLSIDVAALVKPFGKIVSQDDFSKAFTIEVKRGLNRNRALEGLQSINGALYVRASDPNASWETTDFLSADSVRHTINELRARNSDREAMAKALGRGPLEKTEKIKVGYNDALLFWLEERAYPKKSIDLRAYEVARMHRDLMAPAFQGPGDSLGTASFTFVGPKNLDIPYSTYYGVRPINGRVNCLAVSPSDPNTMYLGGGQGGVWKTTNGGTNWTPLTDGWEWMTVSSIAIDPSNSQTLYVGTGDFPGSKPYQFGIMKSTDGGSTWTNQGRTQFGARAVSSIAIDPENPQIITVATGRGSGGSGFVWRSTNGGTTWTSVLNTSANWSQISIGAVNGGNRVYYATGSGTGGNVWRSLDRGATWTKLTIPASAGSHTIISICASPSFPDTVYIVVNADRKVFKSINQGGAWTDITGVFPNGTNNYFWSQSTYNWFLNVSSRPGPQDVIYVGMIDTVQSYDGGATWRSIGGPTYVGGALTHNDQHFCALDPSDPNKVYMGGDGGAYRYTFNPTTNAGVWSYLSANLGVTMFYKADFHPTNLNYMIGGTQDNATPVSVGDLNNWENCGGGDGGFAVINQTTPATQYSTSQNLAVYRTTNNWSSQSTISPSYGSDSAAFIAPIYLDPNNQDLLYAGTNYLYRRSAVTGVWENRLGAQALSASGNLRAVAIAKGDSNRIYTGASDGQVWMSMNAGVSWTQINTGITSLPNRVINYISVNPANKNEILISCSGTGSGHVWKCADTTAGAARTWQNVSGFGPTGIPDIPANTICRDFFDFDQTWFVGTDIGMFMTEDGGATWTNATQPVGLPNTQVNDIKIQPMLNVLYAATYGRGMWRMNLPVVIYPISEVVTSGLEFGGNLASFRESDNNYFYVLNEELTSNGAVEMSFSSTPGPTNEIDAFIETSASRTDLTQFVDLKNATTGVWVHINSRPTTAVDMRGIVRVTTNPSQFVAASGQINARFQWFPSADVDAFDGWTERIDRFALRIVR